MTLQNRIRHLEEMHHVLDRKIDGMESTGAFHDPTLVNLKKKRLQIKDQIARLKSQRDDHIPDDH